MIALGVDQGVRSGWAVSEGRSIVASGVATDHAERLAVLELVKARNGGTLRGVLVMFEDHSGIPLQRLTRSDFTTQRQSGRLGAPERSTASILGQGASKGRWLELLDMLEQPKALRGSVKPHVWRNALGVRGTVGTDAAKRAACVLASGFVGFVVDDHDHAEGILIATYAGVHGLLADEARKAAARVDARGKRQAARQGALAFGGKR